jgi:hypothetical protein
VADGLPDGNAEWFEGAASGDRFRFTSASGRATIEGVIEATESSASRSSMAVEEGAASSSLGPESEQAGKPVMASTTEAARHLRSHVMATPSFGAETLTRLGGGCLGACRRTPSAPAMAERVGAATVTLIAWACPRRGVALDHRQVRSATRRSIDEL